MLILGGEFLKAGGRPSEKIVCWNDLSPTDTPEGETLPVSVRLEDAAPNPVVDGTPIRFSIPTESPVRLDVYDARGAWVARLVDGMESAGEHALRWAGDGATGDAVPNGICFLRIQAGSEIRTSKVVRIR